MTLKQHLKATEIGGSAKKTKLVDDSTVNYVSGTLSQIENYNGNPRFIRNEKYEELKESIRASGKLIGTLSVTKLPDTGMFTTYFGGGTRLQILNELYEETGNEGFFNVEFAVYPFPGYTKLKANHLKENDTHSPLTFIENARAVLDLKDSIETDLGKNINDSEFVRYALEEYGTKIVRQRLKQYSFVLMINDYCPDAVQSGMGRPAIEKLMESSDNLTILCEKLGVGDKDELFTNALIEQSSNETIDSEKLLSTSIEYLADSNPELSTNKIWAVLNEETDAKIPKALKPNKTSRGISFSFLPKSVKSLVSYDSGCLSLTLPVEPFDRADKRYVASCVAFNLILPLLSKESLKKIDTGEIKRLVGDVDVSVLCDISLEDYSSLLKGINAINSKIKKDMEVDDGE